MHMSHELYIMYYIIVVTVIIDNNNIVVVITLAYNNKCMFTIVNE